MTNPVQLIKRWSGASDAVTQAIKSASSRTGVSFDYLMDKAKQESSFKADAKAKTSSATGLFQFIESTWLSAVKSYGDQFGMGHLSAKISADGKVADPAAKQQILALRNDPTTASNIVAAMTKDNADYLENSLGGKVGENELYMAHFLGLGGANKFLKARQSNPNASAADLFPAAAQANKNVFFDTSGKKRSLDDVYNFFAAKFDGGSATDAVTQTASNNNKAPESFAYKQENIFDQGLSISADVALSQGINIRHWGERKTLEGLIAGMAGFGADDTTKVSTNSLLSPYTALVLAKLKAPDEMAKADKQDAENLTA